jgi:hypothetical protein
MNVCSDKIKNQSVAEYAKIKVDFLSGSLTVMLSINVIGITITIGLLGDEFNVLEKAGFMLLIFSAATAVLLFFLAKKYLESVTYRFVFIEQQHMDAIAKVAKRFYVPFFLCLAANMFLSLLGGSTLVAGLFFF